MLVRNFEGLDDLGKKKWGRWKGLARKVADPLNLAQRDPILKSMRGRKVGWLKRGAIPGVVATVATGVPMADLGDCLVMDPSGKVVVQLRGRNVIKAAPGYTVKRVPRGMAGLGEDLFGLGQMMPGAEGAASASADLFGFGRGSMMPGAEGAASEAEAADMFGVGEESDLF